MRLLFATILWTAFTLSAFSQGNYEIQVYGSDTVESHSTMLEVHSNFTAQGTKPVSGSKFTAALQVPTNRAQHETLEITRGINDWFEVGSYIFTSYESGNGYQYVGSHIRPRVRAPESWNLPVGLSLSMEIGYQRPIFSPDTWSWEIRPIIDKKFGRWYFAFNPALEKSLHGPGEGNGFEFAPNVKGSYDFTGKITGGLEYYGSLGPVGDFDPAHEQQHMFFPAIDLNLSPRWELNFGVGIGATASTDHIIVKMILGRRFGGRSNEQGKGKSPVKPSNE